MQPTGVECLHSLCCEIFRYRRDILEDLMHFLNEGLGIAPSFLPVLNTGLKSAF